VTRAPKTVPTPWEIELAEILCERVPAVDWVRFANTGTEAVMFAVKAARAFTDRPKVAKFEGAYHGAYDWVEVSENSEPGNWGDGEPRRVPYARGTPASVLEEVVLVPFNDIGTTTTLLERHGDELACLVMDVLPSRAGLIPLEADYLDAIRRIARRRGIVLISDEVLNFRQGYGGAAARFGIEPDLVTFGKIIGGGLPIGAVGGRADVMAVFDSSDGWPPLPQGGTFAANPLSMVAGVTSMKALDPAALEYLEQLGARVRTGLEHLISLHSVPMQITGVGSPRYDYDFSLAILLVIVAIVLLGEAVSAVARKRIQ
jgi:glutamate-1-semialdehyde 2,1-aminomutase